MDWLVAYSELYLGLGHQHKDGVTCFMFAHTQCNPVVDREHNRAQARYLFDLYLEKRLSRRDDIFLVCNLDRGTYPDRISVTLIRGQHGASIDVASPEWVEIARTAITKEKGEDVIVSAVVQLFFGDEKNYLYGKLQTSTDAPKAIDYWNQRLLARLDLFRSKDDDAIVLPDREIIMPCDCKSTSRRTQGTKTKRRRDR